MIARVARPGRARYGAPRAQAGFTLIELICAFVVFAVGFGVLLQILASSLHTTQQSADFTQAALWAQSMLDSQGVGEPLQEGGRSGQFDDKFSYTLNVMRYQPVPVMSGGSVAPGLAAAGAGMVVNSPGQVEMFQLELIVNWGNQYLQHHARFVTLRAMGPPRNPGQPAL